MLRVYSQYTNGASVCVHCLFSWLHIMNACWNWFLHIIAKIDRYWLELASFSLSTPMLIVCGCFVLVFLQYDPNIDSAPISCRHTQQALWKSAIWHMHRTYAVRLFNMQMTFSISTPNSQVCVCLCARVNESVKDAHTTTYMYPIGIPNFQVASICCVCVFYESHECCLN